VNKKHTITKCKQRSLSKCLGLLGADGEALAYECESKDGKYGTATVNGQLI